MPVSTGRRSVAIIPVQTMGKPGPQGPPGEKGDAGDTTGITSIPEPGHHKVMNMYVNVQNGKLVVVYEK